MTRPSKDLHYNHITSTVLVFTAVFATTAESADEGVQCKSLNDSHGVWNGSLSVGENYTLLCDRGYATDVSSTSNFTLACGKGGVWEQDAHCVQIDDCAKLKNSCGPMGICIDRTDGYRCVCEHGYQLYIADDDSGEWVCTAGPTEQGVCNGNTCGAYGICVDLSKTEANFDSGHVKENIRKGEDTYRCSCAQGYTDDGKKCVPLDCGKKTDGHGAWSGNTTVGGRYSLHCNEGAYIWGGSKTAFTMGCPIGGVWETTPVCVDVALEAKRAVERTYRFWFNIISALLCVLTAATAAGLTMGMVSIEPFEMRVLLNTKTSDCMREEERERLLEKQHHARRLLPVLSDRHLLLVTLLLLNSIANEALPVFLDKIVPEALAVLLSVTAVLIFGEIVPSAVFTGPEQIPIAANFACFVRVLQVLLGCVAWPIARVLDHLLPEEDDESTGRYSRAELRALFALHGPPDETLHEPSQSPSQSPPSDQREVMLASKELPETCPVDDGPTIDGMELTMLRMVLSLRETPLKQCLAVIPLRPERVVCDNAEVRALFNVVTSGQINADWVVVRTASQNDCSSPGSRQLPRTSVLGVLRLTCVELGESLSRPEAQVGTACKHAFEEPVWLHAKDTSLEAFRRLSQRALEGSSAVLGLVVNKADTNIGRIEIVSGVVTLERLAAILSCRDPQHQFPLSPAFDSPRLRRWSSSNRFSNSRSKFRGRSSSQLGGPSPLEVMDKKLAGYALVSNNLDDY